MSFYEDASLIILADGSYDSGVKSLKPADANLNPTGVGDLVVDRNSTATYIDSNGDRKTAAINIARFDFLKGSCPDLLCEPQSTNLFLNSDSLSTQSVTTLASTYTVSFEGTGTIDFSGSFVGSLVGVGDGVSNRVELTFLASAGSLNCTITGDVNFAQCENLEFQTSYIKSEGVITTRLDDELNGSGDLSTFNSLEGVLFLESSALFDSLTNRLITISDGTSNNRVTIFYSSNSNQIGCNVFVGGVIQTSHLETVSDTTEMAKIAFKYKEDEFALWVNGVEVFSDGLGSVFPLNTLNELRLDNGSGSLHFFGRIKQILVFDSVLSDGDLQTLTTI